MSGWVLASDYDAHIGDVIETRPMGEWPGGVCMVVELLPDAAAPEIPFQVELPCGWDIGVFDDEDVRPIRPAANLAPTPAEQIDG